MMVIQISISDKKGDTSFFKRYPCRVYIIIIINIIGFSDAQLPVFAMAYQSIVLAEIFATETTKKPTI